MSRVDQLEEMVFNVAQTFYEQHNDPMSSSERFSDPDENFDQYLALFLGDYDLIRPTYQQYREVVKASRRIWMSSDIYKTALRRRRDFILGDFVDFRLLPTAAETVSEQLNQGLSDDFTKKAMENWTRFWTANRLGMRLSSLLTKLERDGTAYIRYFDGTTPYIRFVDPLEIGGVYVSEDIPSNSVIPEQLGVVTDSEDIEEILGFVRRVITADNTEEGSEFIPVEDMQQFKVGTDFDSVIGIPLLYQVFTNLRRADKMLQNISVLTTIQTAIAMIRKHKNATIGMISGFSQRNATGSRKSLESPTPHRTKRYHSGTVLDAKEGTDYVFPAHNVQAHNWIVPIHEELARVANAADIPVDWLLGTEKDTPLSPSSPALRAFKVAREEFYDQLREMFWRVQTMMGLPNKRNEYELFIDGPVTPTAKPLDQARIDDIHIKHNAKSPQQLNSENGRRYVITRSQVIEHRKTRQPDEQFPSDVGMTNLSDGETKANGDTRVAAGDGGDNT